VSNSAELYLTVLNDDEFVLNLDELCLIVLKDD